MAKRIAVINDDTDFLTLLEELLADEGYDARAFREGKDSYKQVRAYAPHGIVLDIRMESPETGWKVLELFKLDPALSTVPIIICSADLTQLQERAIYLKSKGCEVLAKPFDLSDLLTLLEQTAGRSE